MNECEVKFGDTIKCHDKDEMVQVMTNLAKKGIFTDFMHEKDGVPGFCLVVEKVDYQQWIDRCN